MAPAMNTIGYEAAALGNHEFNYGLDLLHTFDRQCKHPLLCANAVDWVTGAPVFQPWVIKTVQVPGRSPVKVGILGLVTPGVAIWDRANVEGKVTFPGIVEQAAIFVPRLKKAGANTVIVSFTAGYTTAPSYGDAQPHPGAAPTLLTHRVTHLGATHAGHDDTGSCDSRGTGHPDRSQRTHCHHCGHADQ